MLSSSSGKTRGLSAGALFAVAFAVAGVPCRAATSPAPVFCAGDALHDVADDASDLPAPCIVSARHVVLEAFYFQNASYYGGTALAAYPLVDVRVGVARNVEVDLAAPSQIAQSGLGGAGLYPVTRPGFGVRVDALEAPRIDVTAGFKISPQVSRFAPQSVQSQYLFDGTAAYRATRRLSARGYASLETSRTAGFSRIFPSAATGLAYTVGASDRTRISADVGASYVARRSAAQRFGDVAVTQRLGERTTASAALGTTANVIDNAKAHYLAAGLDYRF